MPDQGIDSGLRKRVQTKTIRTNGAVAAPVATPESATAPATSAESSATGVTTTTATGVTTLEPPATSPPPQASTSTAVVAVATEQDEKQAKELAKEKAAWEDMFNMYDGAEPVEPAENAD